MTDWQDRAVASLAVVVVLLAGMALAAGINTALFEAAPLRAGSFSASDVADLVLAEQGEQNEVPSSSSSTTTTAVEVTDDSSSTVPSSSTTSTTVRRGVLSTTTTTTKAAPTTVDGTTSTSTSSTTTTTEKPRGRSDENRGRGGPPDD